MDDLTSTSTSRFYWPIPRNSADIGDIVNRYNTSIKDFSLLDKFLYNGGNRTDKNAGSVLTKYYPRKIIYNGPATIVFWNDGTKTVVKRSKKDKDNKYNAFCAALAIKTFGNNSQVMKLVNSGIEQK